MGWRRVAGWGEVQVRLGAGGVDVAVGMGGLGGWMGGWRRGLRLMDG